MFSKIVWEKDKWEIDRWDANLTIKLIAHAVTPILKHCPANKIDAHTQQWLEAAKNLGVYHGPTTGRVNDVIREWEHWLSMNGGLVELNKETKDNG